ncbi:hypothetical protein AYO21_03505 [Fonsecaea monophora]|uniref:Uncharacterized protein n=1 Tax=Fonsecaea monophora TaxID=254056 RepID=A0A177FDK0_9EURO|nr:hypothetical protein AYO21_03505 [Fonsecaea monophora]OAG42337.1 hypothetical protein AYO21_03505 [Fonsecaea monophora]
MGKNNSKKAARHARITQDFFNQVPESSTEESAKTTAERPSISLPTQVARALNSFVNTSNAPNPTILSGTFQQIDLGDDYRQVACLLGERVFHTFERSKDAARDLLRHFFTTAYLTVDQSTGKREWRVDTDIKIEIVHAIKTNKFIGLFTSQRPVKGTNPVEFEDVIDSPSFLDEFDVIGIIVDFFFDWAVQCADFLRRNPDHKAVDIPFKTYVEHYRPFTCIGIIEIAAAIRNGKTIDIDPRPLEFFIAVRMNNMADEQNLLIQGKPKKTGRKNNKNKGEGKVKATEPDATNMEYTAKPAEKKQDDKDNAADMDVASKPVEKKQVDKDHNTKKNVAVKSAKDLEDDKEDTREDDAAAESTVTKVESTAQDVKGKQVNKDNITLPAATAATDRNIAVTPDELLATMTAGIRTAPTGRNITVTPDDHVATLTAGARNISINDTRTDEDPYGLRNRRSKWSTSAHGSATNNSTAEDDDPLNLRARSRLPAASVIHTDMFTDADGPTPTGPPIPGPATTGHTSAGTRSGYPDLETIRARRHERIRERLARHGANFPTATTATTATPTTATATTATATTATATTATATTATAMAVTATDAPGTECTAPPPRVRPCRRQASAATAGSSTTPQQPRAAKPRETATQRLAKNRLYQELQDLVNTNFPSAAARRTAFAQARQRLLHSETVAAARGEQPLRATATRATQEALTIGRDDALNAVRQQRAAEAARMRASRAGTEANARAREQGFGFDIGGMGGWYGELEAMQIQGLGGNKATGKKEDEAKEK